MKKLICILLTLSLLTALSGCTEPVKTEKDDQQLDWQEEEHVVVEATPSAMAGKWQAQIDVSDFVTDALCEYEALQMGVLVTDFTVTVNMEFREDGTYKVWLDTESRNQSMKVLMEYIHELLWQDMEMLYMDPESDLTLEEAMKQDGVDPDKDLEEIRQHLAAEGYVGQLQERIDREGRYETEKVEWETALFLSEGLDEEVEKNFCDIIELTADQLTFLESYGPEDFEGFLLYPLTFQRTE